MSNQISTHVKRVAVAQPHERAQTPQHPLEKNTPEQDTAAGTALIAAEEASTTYEAMLQEAYDGDTAETMAVIANARRTGTMQDDGASDIAIRIPHEKATVARIGSIDTDAKSEQVLESLRNRKTAGPVTAGQATAPARDTSPSVRRMHDQLMLASSKMGVSEVATHVSLRAFAQLIHILSTTNWLRQSACADNLMKAQMHTMHKARTR